MSVLNPFGRMNSLPPKHQTRLRGFPLPLLLILLLFSVSTAHATYRADFFDGSKPPNISFNKGAMTWTLRNQAVERVIKYDAKTGGLQTVSLRNTKQKVDITPEPGTEGVFSFAAQLMEPPVPLLNWKKATSVISGQWTQTSFDDKAWQAVKLPLAGLKPGQAVWLRGQIPAERMVSGRAYALVLEREYEADYEVYVDGAQALNLKASEEQGKRLLQVDLEPKSRQIAVKVTPAGQMAEEIRPICVAEVGSAPQNIDLKSDWKYLVHAINTGDDGSKTLTITLSGMKRHEGFEVNVSYQVYAGEEPTLAKWFLFVSHRPTRFLMETATYDGWQMPGAKLEEGSFGGTGYAASDTTSRKGLMTAVLSPLGTSERSSKSKSLRSVLYPYYRVKPDAAMLLPKSVVSVYSGTHATGAFLYQLYLGQYVLPGDPSAVPPAFHTGLGYGNAVNAAACMRNMQPASDLGLRLFILGDGWQTNSGMDNGTYGDWNVDRKKFPEGLNPISLLVRQYNMRFGLWTSPALVSTKSQVAQGLSDYLIRRLDGTRSTLLDEDVLRMCFTTGWEENYSQSMLMLCRELTVSYLHLDGNVFESVCTNPTHEHPVGYAESEQIEHLRLFAEKMRKLDPMFLLASDALLGMEYSGLMQTYRLMVPYLLTESEGGTLSKPREPDTWRSAADQYRQTLQLTMSGQPSFALSSVAPARLPGTEKDLNLLEYCVTSAAAMVCNLEIHGEVDRMTAEERDIVRKWVKWNNDNRPYLAFTQKLSLTNPNVDGVLHLRNALNGRQGYIGLWSPVRASDKQEQKVTASFRPADYFVRMNFSRIEVIRVKDGKSVPFKADGDTFRLETEMAPGSWELYEIRVK